MIPASIKEDEFRYQMPTEADLIQRKREIDSLVKSCCDRMEIDSEIETNYCLLSNIIIRVDERKDYYQYFHSTDDSIMKISRGKETALLAYWIVKYKPFRFKNIAEEEQFYLDYKCSFNEVFAASIIMSFIVEETDINEEFFTPNKLGVMVYDLFNRDISKEAMIMFVEAFISNES